MQEDKSTIRQKTYNFSLGIIEFCEGLLNKRIYWSVCDQLMRCGTSTGANIIEAKESSSKKDFIMFCQIALKSVNETKYWLCLLKDSSFEVDEQVLSSLLSDLDEICKITGKSLITLKGKAL